MNFTVAIVGRPNVGKSTLFNRLTKKKHAIVDDTAGVTRDRKIGDANIGPLEFKIIDTPGLEEAEQDSLQNRMMFQTEQAIEESNLVILLVDAKAGLLPDDQFFANWLRTKGKEIILVLNKCEAKIVTKNAAEFYRLGSNEPTLISAEHGEGLVDLYDAIIPHYEKHQQQIDDQLISVDQEKALQIAIVGRPNAGKSTLINCLLNEQRVLTGPEAGITRDSISIDWQYQNHKIRLIDTAGLRKKSKVDTKLEQLAFNDSLRAIKYAQIVILLIDANLGIEAQDLNIANIVNEEGRGLIIALNKWDSIIDKESTAKSVCWRLEKSLTQLKGIKPIYISAMTGNRINELIDRAIENFNLWDSRINTAKLNQWLEQALLTHALPLAPNGRRVKIKYITQTKSRPPTFVLFTNNPLAVNQSYLKYLLNSLREYFNLPGIAIRLSLRKSNNPYQKK